VGVFEEEEIVELLEEFVLELAAFFRAAMEAFTSRCKEAMS
jgi:hypothetical protein